MAVYVIDEVERTIQGQKVANIANIAGAFVKSLSVKANGALEAVIQNAGSAQVTLELVPGMVADESIATEMLQDESVTAAKLAAGVGGATLTRIDGNSAVLTGTTRAVSIAGYAALLFAFIDSIGVWTDVWPTEWITSTVGSDAAVTGHSPEFAIYQRADAGQNPGSCKAWFGKTADGRLKYRIFGDANCEGRIYGIK